MCANGEPYETVKNTMLNSIPDHTQKELIIHDYNLEKMKLQPWFERIQNLPNVDVIGRRDGYYNAYKIFCVMDAYETMNEDTDILLYMDSSQYFRDGFTESVDKLCDIAFEKGIIAGSVGDDVKNGDFSLCHKLPVWKTVCVEFDESIMNKLHILNSWFVIRKNDINTRFMNDWVYWSLYTDSVFQAPLITQHLTVDQSIFNILVYKYKFPVFYHKSRYHCLNKEKNGVLRLINETVNTDDLFITL